VDTKEERADAVFEGIVEMGVEDETPGNGEEDEGVVDEGDDGSGLDIVLQTGVDAVICRTDVCACNALGYSETSSKNGKPHESKECDDIFVVVKDGADSEEE